MRYFIVLFSVFFLAQPSFSQENKRSNNSTFTDEESDSIKSQNSNFKSQSKAKISGYQIISLTKDTTFVDTTLTIKKHYKYNYLRKDLFGLMPFANTGQSYNSLSLENSSNDIVPLFAARARHFNYMETDDIFYYHVPTPLTELYYKTAFEQGQTLDAFFTVNTSKQLNLSIAYKGLRSLGNYQDVLTSTGNFRFITNYKTKNGRYQMRGHITMQDLLNQENGGLTDSDVENFRTGNEDFLDRSVFDPNLQNSENILEGKRFYLDQHYNLVRKKDTLSTTELAITNTLSFQDKYYQFYQDNVNNTFFGDSFSNNINDKVTLEDFYMDFGVLFQNKTLGDISFKLNYTDINYGYNSIVVLEDETITNRIKTNFLGFKGSYQNRFGDVILSGDIGANLSDEIKGNFLNTRLSYDLSENFSLLAGLNINSRLPNFNHLLYQSDYVNYNWDNQNEFENVRTQEITFGILSDKYLNATLSISNIDNYTYFGVSDPSAIEKTTKPFQYQDALQYLKLKVQKEFKFGKFALDNTVMYQNVTSDIDVLNVPALITRNTLYFSDELFKKSLKLQTGVTLNYFTEYNMNGYDPLLAEFYTQNETKLGGFPRLDFFINAKVRQTRIFLKAEHFNSSFTGYDYFSAPNYPFRDFTVRFGLVWNFFL
ncbi:putative porin [Winogradskyella sp. A3E31]|uniref:putative porin n=1 Tax=Winogradskyella sp. A3E31 TaxID=3349637 RepID=UPI00398B9A25